MRRRYVLALVLATALTFSVAGLGVGYPVWHGGDLPTYVPQLTGTEAAAKVEIEAQTQALNGPAIHSSDGTLVAELIENCRISPANN